MRFTFPFLFLLLLIGCEQDTPPSTANVSEALSTLFSEWDEAYLRLNPFSATSRGDHRFNDQWGPDPLSDIYHQKTRALNEIFLKKLLDIDAAQLHGQDRLSFDLFRYQRERIIDAYRKGFPQYGDLTPINQFFNTPNYLVLLGSGENAQPFKTPGDYDNWVARSDGFSAHVGLMIERMQQGVKRGVVQPRILMEKLLPQLAAQQVDNVEDSPFWKPIINFPDNFSETDREQITSIYGEHIMQVLLPAYARLHDYIETDYLPHTRDTIGQSDMPGGAAYYDYKVSTTTTTSLTASEIHEIGKSEVVRLFAQMKALKEQVNFAGDMPSLFEYLRTDQSFYTDKPEVLIEGYEELRVRIAPALQKLFGIQPKTDYVLKEIEPFRAASMAAAQYYPGAADGSRPGIFYVNTYNLPSRPLYMTEVLSLHEASPGHHFQMSISQEMDGLPAFRRFGRFTAYVEGWALYTESLGEELGLYTDPYQKFGSLSAEIWRANRLVVDTGIHSLGWTHQQAVDWMLKYSPMIEADVIAEVDRYIAIPSQALAYKIGQLKIRELRERSEKMFGDAFDIKAFHDQVLSAGALPLSLLESHIDRWIEMNRKAA